ncbi:MAG TPA: hypothetical protein VFX51_03355 [Solirubrobacteraceae bacterium]|nr:hypothetical protein [Solirubrobacteraceae bacterium]
MWEALLAITGSLLFGCASEPSTGELYFKDDAGHVHQLTVTEPKQGAWDAVWQGDRFVAVIDRGFANGLEVRDLSTPATEVGRRLGEGVSPAVSPTGTLAYVRVGERNGKLVDLIVRRRGDRRQVVGYAHFVQQLYWISRHRLVAMTESRAGELAFVDITGRHHGRTVPLRGRRESIAAISAQRRVAYAFGRRGARRIAVMRLDGTHRGVFRRDWLPLTWSPNGRRILVAKRSRVGLMNPHTGAVQRLGRLPCGYFTSAVWTRRGEHPWPPPR